MNPCEGHRCDQCGRCRAGTCCKRDLPDYQLPEEGDWDGPIYGAIGVLRADEDSVECHACGESFKTLVGHTIRAHNIDAWEYKAIFGLRVRTALTSKALSETHRRNSAHLQEYRGNWPLTNLTSEQRSKISRARRISREQRQYIEVEKPWIEPLAKAKEVFRENIRMGKTKVVFGGGVLGKAELLRRAAEGRARMTPEAREAWRKAISEAHGGPPQYECVVCGKRGTARSNRKKTCSRACLLELRRQNGVANNVMRRPDVRAKISSKARERCLERDNYGRIVTWQRPTTKAEA